LGVQVVGVSFDSPSKNNKFKAVEGFTFDLWTDAQRELALHYGAAKSSKQYFASRVTAVIDPKGELALFYSSAAVGFDLYNHAAIVLEDLKVLLCVP